MGHVPGGPHQERLLFANLYVARILQGKSHLEEAEALLRETLAVVSPSLMAKIQKGTCLRGNLRLQCLARLVGKVQNTLGEIVNDSGKSQEAIDLFLSSGTVFTVLYAVTGRVEDGVAVLFATFNTAVAYQFIGQYAEAERLLRLYLLLFGDMVKEKRKFWSNEKIIDRQADVLNGLAVVLVGQQRFVEAAEFAQQALALRLELPERKWVLVKRVMSLQVLAQIALSQDNLGEADRYLEEASKVRRRLRKLWSIAPFFSEFNWLRGLINQHRGEVSKARKYARTALKAAADAEDRDRAQLLIETLDLQEVTERENGRTT